MIKVLSVHEFIINQTNLAYGGLRCQLTECEWNGIRFWVRENVNGIDSFYISSGERWGDKTGNKPRKERQILELFAPDNIWNHLSILVHETDPLNRKVYKNKYFNQQFIDKVLIKEPYIDDD